MENLTFGFEIEILARPRIETPEIRKKFSTGQLGFCLLSLNQDPIALTQLLFKSVLLSGSARRVFLHISHRMITASG
ncbi:hypothetical protein I7I53_00923 [Histoplasma capsulatum var. duboisii H88]|uniref:Uncharacterized protein n=1 Tax=Ajellomyces capsulatus (strain H88) TaxID=544711 RepID=A0A8A1LI59_AJEC8|nr:hypothetical protein I7I53_00923 [Histoplasma capsulatum var. duboisii H88]